MCNVLRLIAFALVMLSGSALAGDRTIYFVPDAQGSPIAALDESGSVIWRESYASYGARLTREPENDANYAYTGKPEDQDTGLVYMGARWYDPESAQFTGIDPQGFNADNPQSWGRYLYANNSPYNYVDPDGELPIGVVALVFAKESAGLAVEAATGVPAVFSVQGAVRKGGQQAAKLYRYTSSDRAKAIMAEGMKPSSTGKVYTTTDGSLSPLQAQIDLALPPNRGLPDALFEIDVQTLKKLGVTVPEATPIRRDFNMPGGGKEVVFETLIPPEAIKRIR